MAQMKCNVCGGTYQSKLPDGSLYFHACPEQRNPLYQPLPTLPLFDPRQTLPQAGARNENLKPALVEIGGTIYSVAPNPNDPQFNLLTPVVNPAIASGAGATQIRAL